MNQDVQKGCSVKILGLRYFVCAKGVVGAKSTVCDRGLLQFGSDMQKGSFFQLIEWSWWGTFQGVTPWLFSLQS
mgnify:CR=1 FL=1